MAQIVPAEGGDARFTGELGDISIQVHAVDAFQFQDDVLFLEFRQAVRYFHSEFGLGLCPPDYGATAACRQ